MSGPVLPPDLPPGPGPDPAPEPASDPAPDPAPGPGPYDAAYGSVGPAPADPAPGAPRRRPAVVLGLGLVVAAAVVAASAVVPRLLDGDATADPAVTGTRTGTSIEGLQVFSDLRTDHVQRDVDYPESPPAGGPHDPVWLACGAYDEPVRDENAVHDLEHGAVWFAYEPGLAADDVRALEDLLPENAIMAPYPGLSAPVVVTVWERQVALDGVDDPRLTTFLQQFGAGETAPELGVSCAGGTTDPGGESVVRA